MSIDKVKMYDALIADLKAIVYSNEKYFKQLQEAEDDIAPHKRGKYYIVHFKELFLPDGKNASLDVVEREVKKMACYARIQTAQALLKAYGPDEN